MATNVIIDDLASISSYTLAKVFMYVQPVVAVEFIFGGRMGD
jgi:hypothetical protein